MTENHWYMFVCKSSPCLVAETSFAVRSSKQLKSTICPVCSSECRSPIAWVADVDGGGGPDEPIVAYVRGTMAKIRNELHFLRKDAYAATQTATNRLEQIHGFLKSKWKEERKKAEEHDGDTI